MANTKSMQLFKTVTFLRSSAALVMIEMCLSVSLGPRGQCPRTVLLASCLLRSVE